MCHVILFSLWPSFTFTLFMLCFSVLTQPSLEPSAQISPQHPLQVNISTSPFTFTKYILLLLALGEVISLPSSGGCCSFSPPSSQNWRGGWSPSLCPMPFPHQAPPVKPFCYLHHQSLYPISSCNHLWKTFWSFCPHYSLKILALGSQFSLPTQVLCSYIILRCMGGSLCFLVSQSL